MRARSDALAQRPQTSRIRCYICMYVSLFHTQARARSLNKYDDENHAIDSAIGGGGGATKRKGCVVYVAFFRI